MADKKPDIIVWGINYAPEVIGIAPFNVALCEYLKSRGYDVRMVTSFPYYPAWKKAAQDVGCFYRTDMCSDIPVHRCWHYVPQKVNFIKRALHETTFVLTSFMRVLSLPRADLIIVISPPLLLGLAAWVGCLLKRSRFAFHVQDMQPGAAESLGIVKHRLLIRLLYWLEAIAYKKASMVSGITPGMVNAFQQKGVPKQNCVLFPNSINVSAPAVMGKPGHFRKKHSIKPEDFLCVYSGNLGEKQGLDVLLDAAARLENPNIKMVICGDGNQRVTLESRLDVTKAKNILLLPLLPENEYQAMLEDADLCIIPQKPGAGNAFFPSKILPSLARSKPILAIADGQSEVATTLEQYRFGICVPPGNSQILANMLERLAGIPGQLEEWGKAGRNYVERFDQQKVHSTFEAEILQRVRA